ncbi:hypothetical protein [Wukongibacter baidiensis]
MNTQIRDNSIEVDWYKVIDNILYDNYWHLVLPLKTAGILSYILIGKNKGFSWSYLLKRLQDKNVDYSIESYPEEDKAIEINRRALLEVNGYKYPCSLEDTLNLLEKLALLTFSKAKDEVIVNPNPNHIFKLFKTLSITHMQSIQEYKEFKELEHVLKPLLIDLKQHAKLKGHLNDYLMRYSCSYEELTRTIKLITTYFLGEEINITEFNNNEYICLDIEVDSKKFDELLFFLNLS